MIAYRIPLAGSLGGAHYAAAVPEVTEGRRVRSATFILTLLLLVSCDDLRDDAGQIDEAGTMSVVRLRVGDCLNEPDGRDEFDTVSVVPCDRVHELEVFAIVEHPASRGAPYPPGLQLDDVSFDLCYAFFRGYVGKAYKDSLLDIDAFLPTRESWAEAHDREIVCLLFDVERSYMVGSMRGSRR